MPQLHLYLPREIADEVKRRAEAQKQSVSAYLADIVKHHVSPVLPESFFTEVVGCWQGEPLERPPQLPYEERLPFD